VTHPPSAEQARWRARLKARLKAALPRAARPRAAAGYLQLKELARRLGGRGDHLSGIFGAIHDGNMWGQAETVSGLGSTLEETRAVRAQLPPLLRQLGVRSLLDVPCGDCNWLVPAELGLERYTGIDIVPALVERNRRRVTGRGVQFAVADFTADGLPGADLILCRDALIHLSFFYIRRALTNFRASGATWLLTTHYPGLAANQDILSGQWRPLDLELPPFRLPPPRQAILEKEYDEDGRHLRRTLSLWRLEDVRS
jgi:SAM-dependent methyltransferase